MFEKQCENCIHCKLVQDGMYKDHLSELEDVELELGIEILDRDENGEYYNLSKPYEYFDCTEGVELYDCDGPTYPAPECEMYAGIELPRNELDPRTYDFDPAWLNIKARWWLEECSWLKA
jgi:hypothetical protein